MGKLWQRTYFHAVWLTNISALPAQCFIAGMTFVSVQLPLLTTTRSAHVLPLGLVMERKHGTIKGHCPCFVGQVSSLKGLSPPVPVTCLWIVSAPDAAYWHPSQTWEIRTAQNTPKRGLTYELYEYNVAPQFINSTSWQACQMPTSPPSLPLFKL